MCKKQILPKDICCLLGGQVEEPEILSATSLLFSLFVSGLTQKPGSRNILYEESFSFV